LKKPRKVSRTTDAIDEENTENDEIQIDELESKHKRKDNVEEPKGKVKKIAVLIARGELLLGVVLHIVAKYYGGEYDPLYVERVKQTLFMLFDEKLFQIVEANMNKLSISTPYHAAKLMNKVPPMHFRVPKKVSGKKRSIPKTSGKGKAKEEEKDHFAKADNIEADIKIDQPRVSIIRSSELLSHEIKKNKKYDSHRDLISKIN